MNSTATMSLLMASSLFAAGCATRPATAVTYNPMPEFWASIAGGIAALKKVNATRTQWTKAADSASPILTVAQLHTAIAATGAPADAVERQRQLDHLESLFHTSRRTIHFGFECDHHAIVFFDSQGRQRYAHP